MSHYDRITDLLNALVTSPSVAEAARRCSMFCDLLSR
jgi:hypothetical protein